ncbi:hypothetical protein [Caballeronia sp. 15711]|uniref:hypothetical protein n=1 Tax=Caballeronia sp. 15711 TaxID=3391029 RepID=UPI0039E49DF6
MSQKSPLANATVLRNDDVSLSGYFALPTANRWPVCGIAGIIVAVRFAHVFISLPACQAGILVQGEDSFPSADLKRPLRNVLYV